MFGNTICWRCQSLNSVLKMQSIFRRCMNHNRAFVKWLKHCAREGGVKLHMHSCLNTGSNLLGSNKIHPANICCPKVHVRRKLTFFIWGTQKVSLLKTHTHQCTHPALTHETELNMRRNRKRKNKSQRCSSSN